MEITQPGEEQVRRVTSPPHEAPAPEPTYEPEPVEAPEPEREKVPA